MTRRTGAVAALVVLVASAAPIPLANTVGLAQGSVAATAGAAWDGPSRDRPAHENAPAHRPRPAASSEARVAPASAASPRGTLDAWSAALADNGRVERERRDATRHARLELRRLRTRLGPSWSLRPAAAVGFDGGWDLELNGRLEVPVRAPDLERRRAGARERLELAALNERLARREARASLWSDLIGWRRVKRTAALVREALSAASGLPPAPHPDVQEEHRAWARFADELALERDLLRERLHDRTGFDPQHRMTPPLLTDPGLTSLLQRAPAAGVEACIARNPNVLRARRAVRAAMREREELEERAPRVAVVVTGDLRVGAGGARADPSAEAGASLRLDVGLPSEAPLRAGVEVSASPRRIRAGASISGPAEPRRIVRPVADAVRDLDEARFEARVRLRRAALERRHLRDALLVPTARGPEPSAPAGLARLRAPIRAARDLPALLVALDASVAELSHRARLATVAAELATACGP